MSVISGHFDPQGRAVIRLRLRGTGDLAFAAFENDTGAQPGLVTSQEFAEVLMAEMEPRHMATLANGVEVPATAILLEVEWLHGPQRVMGVCFANARGFLRPGQRGAGIHGLIGRDLLVNTRLTIDYGRASVAIEPSELSPA